MDVRLCVGVLRGVRRGPQEVVELRRVAVLDLARDRPHLHRLGSLVAQRVRQATKLAGDSESS